MKIQRCVYGYFYTLFLIFSSIFFLSAQENSVVGVWENGGRFVEFYEKEDSKAMRVVLKPYYATVYDEPVLFSNPFENDEMDSVYALSIRYPSTKRAVSLPNSYLFTSFYKKVDFELLDGNIDDIEAKEEYPLFGFWVEQGSKDGILLYPNEASNNFDAYFFEDNKYIKFRYWHDEALEFSVPKMIKRGDMVYSCITTNGSSLRNYECGTYRIETDKFSQDKGVFLVLDKEGALPGKVATSDVYPNYKYANKESIPLYLMQGSNVFAIGGPFLFRSSHQELDEEIKRHNALRNKGKVKTIRDEDIIVGQ